MLMGQLVAFANCSENVSTDERHQVKERERVCTNYYHQGKVVCRKMFAFIHGIRKKRLKNITWALMKGGIGPR